MEFDINERRFFLVSIKHSEYPKGRRAFVLWGETGKTADDKPRCYGGYTTNPDCAEVYSMADLQRSGYGPVVKTDESVPMTLNLVKKWRKYDSVAVDINQYRQYLLFV